MSLMSTTFKDGPAKGTMLSLARSPIMLRVTFGLDGRFDALDELGDRAEPDEAIYAYYLTAAPGVCFIDGRDPKTGRRCGERRSTGTYALHPEQPPDATMRDNAKWQAWCRENMERLTPAWAKGRVQP